MKILFVGPVPPLTGGISHHSSRLVNSLRSRGHSVDVISWRDQYPRLLYRGNQRDDSLEPMPGAEFCLSWWSITSWWQARRAAATYDLLIYSYVTPFHAIAQWLISGNAPAVLAVVHNALPHERMPFERLLGRVALKNATLAVAHGEGVADDLRSIHVNCGIDVLPMPPILEVEATQPPPMPPFRLLFLGYVRPYKGLSVAISSLPLVIEAGIDATLTVMGDFWEPVEGYEEQISRLRLTGRVELRPGYASDDDLREALRTHHVVVAPYLDGSVSGVIPLSLAAGRPVVSTEVGGIPEQVRDGVDGFVVSPGNDQALAQGIQQCFEQYAQLAKGARESGFSWSQMADSILTRFAQPTVAEMES